MGFKCDSLERKYHLKCVTHAVKLTTEPDSTDTID